MTPEALALHFIDDLDSKINQLRNSREAATGMQFHRGLGRYVYFTPDPTPGEIAAAREEGEIEAIAAEPHALEMAERERPPDEDEDEEAAGEPEPAEVQAGLFPAE